MAPALPDTCRKQEVPEEKWACSAASQHRSLMENLWVSQLLSRDILTPLKGSEANIHEGAFAPPPILTQSFHNIKDYQQCAGHSHVELSGTRGQLVGFP